MTSKTTKSTGLGADAFFQAPATVTPKPVAPIVKKPSASTSSAPSLVDDKTERRSFNLKLSTLRLLDEVQIKTMREGKKSTLSAIVERGIEHVAKEMGVNEALRTRTSKGVNE